MKRLLKKILLWTNVVFALLLLGAYASNKINPEILWQFAFFGLLYPYVFVVNLGFIIFWLWRRKWFLMISLGLIIFGWNNIGKYWQLIPDRHHDDQIQAVKVMSYNVRLFNHYEWDERQAVRDSILSFVVLESPGIVCFQEYFTVTNEAQQSEKHVDESLGVYANKHIFYTYKTNIYSNYGLATYSRYPIVQKKSIRFSDSYNACIVTDIKIGSDTVRVFNVHLESIKLKKENYSSIDSLTHHFNSKQIDEVIDISGRLRLAYVKRARQVDELNAYVRQSPYPVIVCGDFNDTPVSYTYNTIRGDMGDAYIESGSGFGNTYRGRFPSFRIDYIFHSLLFEATNYKTHEVNYSDHYPVSCNLHRHR